MDNSNSSQNEVRHKPDPNSGTWLDLAPCACPHCGCEELTSSRIMCDPCMSGDHIPCASDCEAAPPHSK